MTTSPNGFQATNEVGVYKIALTRENLKFNDGEFRLEPTFTKIGSEVQATSTKVKGGTIESSENVQNGSLKLSVTDANVSEERREAFAKKAAEEGYTVSNIFDISLFNSIYKGGKKDTNGNFLSWDKEINNLSKKASIGLELQENMAGKEVALVHETHDGDTVTGYEMVDANYNSSTNIVSFEEANFSNFAIVVKDADPNKKEMVKIDFDTRAEKGMDPVEIEKGSKLEQPADPVNEGKVFGGWYIDEAYHDKFDFNTPVDKDMILYAKWDDDGPVIDTDYEISDAIGNMAIFKAEAGHKFTMKIVDYLTIDKKDLPEEVTEEVYNTVLKSLKEATKKYGDLLAFDEIFITDEMDRGIPEESLVIKFKLTNQLKKYEDVKLIYVNEDFSLKDPVSLKEEDGYLVAKISSLDKFVLTGKVKTALPDVPKTGDNIYTWVIILITSIVCITVSTIFIKKPSKVRIKK